MSAMSEHSPEMSDRHRQNFARRSASASRSMSAADAVTLKRLIISGWVIALLYLPSGFLHTLFGPITYVRDLLLALHLAVSILWLARIHQLRWCAQHSWVILVIPIVLIPALLNRDFTVEALRFFKWSLSWLDWILLGHFLRLNKDWGSWFKWMVAITGGELLAELVAGLVEWQTGKYLFPTAWGERTALGVLRGNDQLLEGRMRIRGLQRDVFSFSNLMAMSAVAGMVFLIITRTLTGRIAAAFWIAAFGAMMVISGGRSALFGAFAAAGYAVAALARPAWAERFSRWYVLAWVAITLTLSFVGVGKFTDVVGRLVFGGSHVGDSESAYMRDDAWAKMRGEFRDEPMILVGGAPFASILERKIDTMFHWADNQFLWNLYHTGLLGSLAIFIFFHQVLAPQPRSEDWPMRHALVLFLCSVIGEGIARESMTFMGSLPLFILCGYASASEMRNRQRAAAAGQIVRRPERIIVEAPPPQPGGVA